MSQHLDAAEEVSLQSLWQAYTALQCQLAHHGLILCSLLLDAFNIHS